MKITKIFAFMLHTCLIIAAETGQAIIVLEHLAPEDLHDLMDQCYQGSHRSPLIDKEIKKSHRISPAEQQLDSIAIDKVHHKIIKNCVNSSLSQFKAKMIKYGAVIQGNYLQRASLLHYACARTKDLEISKYLLQKGISIETRDITGATPLHWACKYRNLIMLNFLLDNDANYKVKDNAGNTLLHWAYRYKSDEIISRLLQLGVDSEIVNRQGYKPSQVLDDRQNGCCVIL